MKSKNIFHIIKVMKKFNNRFTFMIHKHMIIQVFLIRNRIDRFRVIYENFIACDSLW